MVMRSRYVAAALALVLLAAQAPGAAAADHQPGLPDARFGIAEGFRNPSAMIDLHAGWERLIFGWDQIQPDGPGDFSRLGITIAPEQLQAELDRGIRVVGLLEFTPEWAAADPSLGKRSPPRNLDLPFDHPDNYWGQVVFESVRHYAGRIDDWVIWNEPEFRPTDPGAGGSYTWLGSEEEFAQLLKVGYLAAKRANPNVTVSFPGTSYWVEYLVGRAQFYDRVMSILASDPDAAANGFFHDVVALNLYRAPDDVFRIYTVFKGIQQAHGVNKPIWLTETNAMPSDDFSLRCPHADEAIQTSMEQQAAYAIQAFALAAAAGYARFEVYQMIDGDTCVEPAVWGVTRDDGSRRPIAEALRLVNTLLGGYTSARFVPDTRETAPYAIWPDDQSSIMTNWRTYQVAVDRPGDQRVTVVWNGDGRTTRARIRQNGTSARVVDRRGESRTISPNQGWWVLDLPPATAHYPGDPEGYYFIGGDPLFLVEEGVRPDAPIAAPALGDPSNAVREFRLFPSPAGGATVAQGQVAEFFISSRGYEGFADPIAYRMGPWSTQRFPDQQDPSRFPLPISITPRVSVGDTATVRIDTAAAEPGIYYLTVYGEGGGMTQQVDLALVIE
jgi:hypothetical protein